MGGLNNENYIILINFTIQEKYVNYIGLDPELVALYIVLLVILETLGNFLLLCMILHEKYGMDPQKRTVTNQLLSKMLIVQIFCNVFIMPLFALFSILGLQSK